MNHRNSYFRYHLHRDLMNDWHQNFSDNLHWNFMDNMSIHIYLFYCFTRFTCIFPFSLSLSINVFRNLYCLSFHLTVNFHVTFNLRTLLIVFIYETFSNHFVGVYQRARLFFLWLLISESWRKDLV